MDRPDRYSSWSRISKQAAKEFFAGYVEQHPKRLAALGEELAGAGVDVGDRLDMSADSLVWLWTWVVANNELPTPAMFYSEAERKEVEGVQPGLTSWYGFAPEPAHPDPERPLLFVGSIRLSLDQARLGSLLAAYIVEMLSDEFPDVVWETHSHTLHPGELKPCFGGVTSPEQSVQRLLLSALEGRPGAGDPDALLMWYLDCRDVLEDTPLLRDTLVDPDPDSEIEVTETGLDDEPFMVEFDDEFAHARSGQIDRFVRHLSRAHGVDWAERTDREVVTVGTTLDLIALRRLAGQIHFTTHWSRPIGRHGG